MTPTFYFDNAYKIVSKEAHYSTNMIQPIFPLSCVHECAHTGHEKTLSAHKCSLKTFSLRFHTRRSRYRRVLVKYCTNISLCTHRF